MDCNCILMFMRYAFTLICEYLKVLLKKSKHFKLLWINWSRTFSFNFKLWQIYWNTWNIFGGNYKRHNYFFIHMINLIDIYHFTERCQHSDDANVRHVSGQSYWTITNSLNFTEAHKRCQEEGGMLAEIPDQEAQTKIKWIKVLRICLMSFRKNM